MTSRERVLDAIRRGLPRAALPDAAVEHPGAMPAGMAAAPIERGELVGRFSKALESLGGVVHHADSVEQVAQILVRIAAEAEAAGFISWDGSELECAGLLERLDAMGLSRVPYDLSPSPGERQREVLGLDPAPLGLTGALGGLADTGGLIVTSGRGRGRLVSLLPPVHVALLQRDRLFDSFSTFLAARSREAAACSNLVVIAGPSRTADIEMTLSHGVHGPKAVHAILYA